MKHEALLLTTYSTVSCIRYLLKTEKFFFVVTRKFSSDPVESFFGTLRRSVGCNDQLDARSAISGFEKVLKTGIAAASGDSNVLRSDKPGPSSGLQLPRPQECSEAVDLPVAALNLLKHLKSARVSPSFPTLQHSATVYLGGYIRRIVEEHAACEDCCA